MSELDEAKLFSARKLLKKNKFDGYVISNLTDLKYIMGQLNMNPDEAFLLIHQKGIYMVARSLYEAPYKTHFPQIEVEGADCEREKAVIAAAKRLKLKKVAFDGNKISYNAGAAFVKAGFEQAPGIVDRLRVVKTEEEIKIMKASAAILYGAIKYIAKFFKAGVTERELAARLEDYIKANGAEGTSFTTIVAFGPGTSDPHYATGSVKLKKNMPILIDFGCMYKGYASDITRVFWFGDKPAAEFEKIFSIVKSAHDKVVREAKPGMSGAEIDAIARDYISRFGYGPYFTHRTGHGIGMETHEQADISSLNKEKILKNYCFSVEPGIYLEGKFGVRYEDCYYMSEKGPKRLA